MIENIGEACTGCYACYNACPRKSIEMIQNDKGFIYPKVNRDKCVECNICRNVCPQVNFLNVSNNYDKPKIYAGWSLDENIRLNSTSGGIFSELSKSILSKGGYVVGARYNDEHLVEHYMIDKYDDIILLRQSKYIQSEIGLIFKCVKEKLERGSLVAFCGSPCQIAGLQNYLKKNYSNLICFDFVCRGVNSPKAYTKYLEMLEKEYKSNIKKVWFKNKTYGWNNFSTKIEFTNGKTYIKDRNSDLFMRGYIEQNLYIRECCFNCKYKEFPRVADITLADFWGVGEKDKTLDSDKGTSLIMINSAKGKECLKNIQNSIFYKEMSLEDAINGNGCIYKSVEKNPKSDKFLRMLNKYEFDVCFKKCSKENKIKKFKRDLFAKAYVIKQYIFKKNLVNK
ncbi:MAG: Coenzyme F420 hydrogenase/dehydrogenase, beta subunit C-terminal domain [Clostridium sp.]|nr:Coenzyme F420 hydrogenase/dehydrogenase, beta subunit C-terminal domain [Clostridium sp.]MDU7084670.1 Coenzyme F420 hydrogenase/dehydrogenase, beta subunit C-terminal domain [Clostridium sp.]